MTNNCLYLIGMNYEKTGYNMNDTSTPTLANSMFTDDYKNILSAITSLADILMKKDLKSHEVLAQSKLTFMDYSTHGWEKLYEYLRTLENDLEKQKNINAVLTNNLETLIETVEAYNVKIVAMYRGLFNTVDYKE